MSDLGELLRQARERKGVTLEEVEAATRIRRKFLEALEQGDLSALPGEVYARGFARSYAAFLGLDPDNVVALLPPSPDAGGSGGRPLVPLVSVAMERPRSTGTYIIVVAVVVVLAIVGVAVQQRVWQYIPSSWSLGFGAAPTPTSAPTTAPTTAPTEQPTATQAAPTEEPAVMPSEAPTGTLEATPTATEITGVVVKFVVTGRSWLQVTVDNKIAYSGVLSDETREWVGTKQIDVRIGDAARVDVTVNGNHLGVLGQPEEVVSRSWFPGSTGMETATPTPEPGG